MTSWIDPQESEAEAWTGSGASLPGAIESTVERAHAVDRPFQYREHRTYEGTLDGVVVEDVEYTSGNFVVDGGVSAAGTVKLHARGLLWREGTGEGARRFKMQLVREPPVTESVPFGAYESWERFELGDVAVDEVDGPTFLAEPGTRTTRRGSVEFGDLLEPLKRRVAELELVRNPPFAKYRLAERGEWEAYGAVFRWQESAFGRRLA